MAGLSPRQREVLDLLGIPLWVPRSVGAQPLPAPTLASAPSAATNFAELKKSLRTSPPAQEAHPTAVSGTYTQDLDTLREQVRHCTACKLAPTRRNTVFGVGDPQADWLFVGEAPGAEEDRLGDPFVGRAGQLLDNMLAAMGLHRQTNVYIANVIKCRPPGNRNPEADEVAACRGYLDQQIALIQPRLIVALGRVAAQALLDSQRPLRELRGAQNLAYQNVPVIVTYHPAYLLRFPEHKAQAWKDLCLALDTLNHGPTLSTG